MLDKILEKYSQIIGYVLTGIVTLSVGTISLFGQYEYQMPIHLISNDDK